MSSASHKDPSCRFEITRSLRLAVEPIKEGLAATVAGAARATSCHSRIPRTERTAMDLCVPKTSSTSCDQAVFVDQATDSSLFSDAVVIEIDRFG